MLVSTIIIPPLVTNDECDHLTPAQPFIHESARLANLSHIVKLQ
jgi:hypothetical protein